VSLAPATALERIGSTSVAAVIVQHSKSFSLASRLLPTGVRDDAVLLYAWCRYADDAVDEAPESERVSALERLEAELESIYSGEALNDPLLDAFAELVRRVRMPKRYPAELVAGMRMDVEGYRYRTGSDLMLYCYRVAGTVGLMMCHVMGVRGSSALRRAAHLGMAMQLTNICRDVVEDWHRGRVYLPDVWLAEHGVEGALQEPAGAWPEQATAGVAQLVLRLLERSESLYQSGDRGRMALPWRCAVAVGVARRVYSAIGDVLQRRGGDVTQGRAYVGTAGKLWLVGRELVSAALAGPRRILRALRQPRFELPKGELPFDDALPAGGGQLP
jgi:phytoene synthase